MQAAARVAILRDLRELVASRGILPPGERDALVTCECRMCGGGRLCVYVWMGLREDESIGGNCCRWTVSNRVCAIARRSKVHGEGGCDAELCG